MRVLLLFLSVTVGLLLWACGGGAPPSTATPSPTPIPASFRSCSPQDQNVPCAQGVAAGKPYNYQLYTHCGIRWAYFDGRWWKASPVLDDGSRNPPRGWGNPFDIGSMVLSADDRARFTSAAGLTATFESLARDIQDYPGEICL